MDVLPSRDSLVPGLPDAGAIVLRSFGKIYGLAGLRLGFAAAPPPIAAPLRQAIGPWAVSGPAIDVGRRALVDTAWLSATIARLRTEAARLDRLLHAMGFEIAGGTPLFRLAVHPDAPLWFDRLGRAGILTRPFLARPDWLRFGIPHAPDDWARLEAASRSDPA
jgi:cobalamin biosynthetic protein CobC